MKPTLLSPTSAHQAGVLRAPALLGRWQGTWYRDRTMACNMMDALHHHWQGEPACLPANLPACLMPGKRVGVLEF